MECGRDRCHRYKNQLGDCENDLITGIYVRPTLTGSGVFFAPVSRLIVIVATSTVHSHGRFLYLLGAVATISKELYCG